MNTSRLHASNILARPVGCDRRTPVPLRVAWPLLALAIFLAGCSQPPPAPAPQDAVPPVTRTPQPVTASVPAAPGPSPATAALPAAKPKPAPVVVPEGAIYVCVAGTTDAPRHSVIEYSPKVDTLCRKHPEMGPCQYERNLCRRGGGRVYAAGGVEITAQTEAEYDRKVMRVRFQAN